MLAYITLMIQDVLADNTHTITLNEDRRALTPLLYSHVDPYGEFHFDLDTRLALTGYLDRKALTAAGKAT